MPTLEIQLDKSRIITLTALFLTSVILALLLAYYLFLDQKFSFKLIIMLLIAIPILIFIIGFTIKKVLSNKPALILDSKGILDNINLSEVGTISWNNIVAVNMVKHQYSNFIIIKLANPENILKRLHGAKLTLAKNNISNFGSPCIINVSNLKFDRFELFEILENQIGQWNNQVVA